MLYPLLIISFFCSVCCVGAIIHSNNQGVVDNQEQILSEVLFFDKKEASKTWIEEIRTKRSDEYTINEKWFQKNEIFYKSNNTIRNGNKTLLRKLYCSNVNEFTEDEKKKWKKACYKANFKLKKIIKNNLLDNGMKWKFILMGGDMDWKLPYTLGDTIILPESKRKIYDVDMLVHEAIHILQKGDLQTNFEKKNASVGFIKLDHKDELLRYKNIRDGWITNPDGMNGTYIFKTSENTFISPLLLLNKKKKHDSFYVEVESDGKVKNNGTLYNLKKNNEYMKLNKNVYQNYHPHEITAETMSL